MHVRILFYMAVITAVIPGCKKDSSSSHVLLKGIVLNKEGNAPLANAKVFIYFNSSSRWPFPIFFQDSTQTNASGQYEISMSYKNGMEQYFVHVKKDSLVQATRNRNHVAKSIDSVLMEKPSYVHVTVKITQPVSDSITLWMLHFDAQRQQEIIGSLDPPPVFKQPGTYSFVCGPFSSSLHNMARVMLVKPVAPPGIGEQPVAEKEIQPVPYTTTLLEIEY